MPNETKNYDLIIIGGGPAGLVAATTATEKNKTVALIDSHHELGGAGINTGTVPSKTLRETALALSGLKSRDLYGVDLSLRRQVTISDFLGHEQNVRAIFNVAFLKRLESEKVGVFFGTASFVDPHTVSVLPIPGPDGQPAANEPILLRGENILIATGSSPVRPDLFPFGTGEIYDSDTILKLDRIPKKMAVIGSGVIGSEYGCTFAALEAEVHIIDGRDKLLPFLDIEVSLALAAAMERGGIAFHWNEKVTQCAVLPSGGVTLSLSSGASLTVDAVLVAAGRKSNTETLNLASAGVATGERGIISVDKEYRTNVPHIFAAGDVIGFPALASTSMEQGRRAARHALGMAVSDLSPLLPNGIYTIPEVSMVGETEESLKKKRIDYVVGRTRYEDNARGQIIGDKGGFLKLLYRRDNMKLVGVHVIGELATEIVHIGLMAMLTGSTAEIFVEACFNVPTLGMLYKTATLHALREAAAGA
ncbi:MAG TPA: Si-specific NAD(P)(+) transhydrogenase [Candidatus Methylacidiphilales bacterium]|jgi:NAD(P) transhydrogenase|nr:Si-specific NAD(P)(+) transhydrogenase [Candidatus Methylacidiphilales bacterium]